MARWSARSHRRRPSRKRPSNPSKEFGTINPLLYEGETITGYKGMNDLVVVAERISDNTEALHEVSRRRAGTNAGKPSL